MKSRIHYERPAIYSCGILLQSFFAPFRSLVSSSLHLLYRRGARCSSVVRAFAHGTVGRRIDPLWGGPIELFLVPANAPRLV